MKRFCLIMGVLFICHFYISSPCFPSEININEEKQILEQDMEISGKIFFSTLFTPLFAEGMAVSEKSETIFQEKSTSIKSYEQTLSSTYPKISDSKLLFQNAVRSTWADKPMVIAGELTSREWSDAGKMAIPGGYLLVKNDNEFMYVSLDLTSDNGNDTGTGDYFWFSIDVDQDEEITPDRDINYGLYVDQPNHLARQYYKGPGCWAGIVQEESESSCHIGFGSSPNKAYSHRVWELKFSLKELGIADMEAAEAPPVVRFGVRVHSDTPSFTYDTPSAFYTDFCSLKSIILATRTEPQYADDATGSVIGGVGLIPFTQITDGYGSADPSYLNIDEAAFGGRLDIIGNRETMADLWDAGARQYRIYHRAGNSGSYQSIRQQWSNYRWTGTKYVLETFGPDDNNRYDLLNPNIDYSIDDLLMRWNSREYASGLHHFYATFYDDSGNSVYAPVEILTLMVDNHLPTADIVQIRHDGYEIPACSIEDMTGPDDGVTIKIEVNDPEGHLRFYRLSAHFGEGDNDIIEENDYTNNRSSDHQWSGTPGKIEVPEGSEWLPPYPCAYQFRLTAYPRTTNGYGWITSHSTDTHHVTLIMP